MAADLKTALLIALNTTGEERVAKLRQSLLDLGISADKAEDLAAGLDSELRQIADSSGAAEKKSLDLAGALKTVAGAAIVREFIQANASLESIEKSLEAVTGSAESAKQEMEFIRAEAMRLGVDTASAASSFLTLAAATKGTTLEGEKTRDIWSAVAGKMTELGASSADVAGAMTQLAQGASKGKFELEDLKSIAERIPGFFGTFAKSLGVTNERFFEMVSAGQITADLLPKLAGALGGAGGDINTFNATLGRMKNALTEVATSIGDTGIFDALTWSLSKLADATSFATIGFKTLAARVQGDDAALTRLAEQGETVKNRLFGLGDAAKKAGDDVAVMGAQVAATSTQIEQDVRDKIVASLIKLSGEIKTTDDAFKALGVDPGKITTGISTAERAIIESFKKIAADPNTNGQVLLGSLLAALDKVGRDAIPEIGFAYKAAANQGKQSADEMASGMGAVKSAIDFVPPAVNKVEQAYKTLGIQSQAALEDQAEKMREAYEAIEASGTSLAIINAAWAKYAEAAIAANGGIADSTIQAEAAQRGYVIAVDESGRAIIKLKSVTDDYLKTLEAQRAAGYAAQDAMRGLAEASLEAYQATSGGIGGMQKSIDDFHVRLRGLGEAYGQYWNNLMRQARDISADAADEMERFIKTGTSRSGAFDWVNEGVRYLAELRKKSLEQNAALDAMVDKLKSGSASMADLAAASRLASGEVSYVSNERLQTLRDSLADAKRRMLDLRDAAADTLADLRDELDQLNDNYDDIERRRAEQRDAELRAQLQAAKASGDREAIADLEEALRLLKLISAERIKDAETRGQTTTSSSGGGTTSTRQSSTTTGGGSGGVTFNFQGAVFDPESLVRAITPALDKINRLRS